MQIQTQTHEVINQAIPLENYNLYYQDIALKEALHREGGGWAHAEAGEYGKIAGSELLRLGFDANQNKPVFHSHDRFGHRIDVVEYHPA